MPELPEVEALRRGLIKHLTGSKILNVKVLQEKIIAGKGTNRIANKNKTKEFIDGVTNAKILKIERRAKNLVFKLEGGKGRDVVAPQSILLVHLKMTGQLVFVPHKKMKENFGSESRALRLRGVLPGQRELEETKFSESSKFVSGGHPIKDSETQLPNKHTYIIFELDNGTLYYNDVRQFGYVLFFPDKNIFEQEQHFENIGLEPFDKKFTLDYFSKKLKEKNTPIKKVLLDQTIVVGCGNIYSDEILWASSVLPTRATNSLNKKEVEKIYENIKIILKRAIEEGGSSVANYLLADGKKGNFANFHNAYKKQDTNCKYPRCTGKIIKITLFGRGTHYCPKHQK